MAKYQEFLSRVGSNRDRAALRGIFSQFLTDGDPPALKDLVLASIILSGAETTQITISGANTTGILLSGTSSADGISITGVCADGIHISGSNTATGLHISGDQVDAILIDGDAAANNGIKILVDDGITIGTGINIDRSGTTGICTTGISIDTDGTTGIEIAAGFTGVNMISLAGTASTSGILISGVCASPLAITGAFTTGITIAADGTTAIEVTSAFSGVTGLSFAGTASGDGILVSGVCADGIHISGSNTASGLHISGDQVDSILIDVDAATANVLNVSVDDGITATVGINIGRTGTTGICTTGIMIDTDGTTALWIGTGFTGTTGILIEGTATNAISITGVCTTAINIARATAKTAIRVGEWAASQAAGSAVVFATNMAGVDTSQLNIVAVFGESTSDLTSAYSTSVIRGRHLVSAAADTEFTQEVYGVMGQVVCKNASFNHYASGVMGTFEASNTLTHVMSGYVAAAVTGRLGGGVLTCESGGIVAGVAAINNSSAHTATGIIAGFVTHNTAAGIAWPIGLSMAAGSVTQAIQIGLSTSAPILVTSTGTSNMVEVNSNLTAISGTMRGAFSYVEASGVNVGTAINIMGFRGYAKVSGTYAGADAFASGVQGKVELSGTMTDGRLQPVLAQINSSAGTFTAGILSGIWIDSQITSGQQSAMSASCKEGYNMVRITNGANCNAMFYLSGTADNLMQISLVGGTWANATATVSVASGTLRVLVGGTVKYIQLYNS